MNGLIKSKFYNNANVIQKEENINQFFKQIVIINNHYVNLKILNAIIDENICLDIVDSTIKQPYIQRLRKNGKHLEIFVMLNGNIELFCKTTRQKRIFNENEIIIDLKEDVDECILNRKNQRHKYIRITLDEDFLNKNDYFASNNLTLAKKIIFRPDISSQLRDLLYKNFDNNIDKLFLKIKIFELIIYATEELKNEKNKNISCLNEEDVNRICKAKNILDNYFFENITIPILSKKVALNQTKLKKGFKQLYGRPIHDYLKNIRLQSALLNLKSNKYSIKEISLMSGYKNQGSFTYAFLKKFNCLPKDISKKSNL